MKTKYKWAKIYIDFLTSDIHEVKEYFESKYSTYTGHIKLKTRGWSESKKQFIQNYKDKADAELKKKMSWMKNYSILILPLI